jgi:hypothetical protein
MIFNKLREIVLREISIQEKVINMSKRSIQSQREIILTFNNRILKTQKQKRSRRTANHKIVSRDF